MKFTLGWLKEHLDTDVSLTEITDKLTAIGLELEGVDNPAEALSAFVVAEIVECGPHPDADKLRLCKVDDGSGEPKQVVCGAPNAAKGLKGVFAPVGAYVPGLDFTLKAVKIRGADSFGMLCAEDELGIGESHDGIIELPADAPVGTAYPAYAGLDDPIIDVAITPNRQDCMGVRGIARDLAAAGLGTLRPLAEVYRMDAPVEGSGPGPDVRTEDSETCPAFYAQGVSGLINGTAPDWMTRKLQAIGQKPISTLVDITNFVMIDLGRPLHVYDKAKLSGGLVARLAKPGEQVLALNGRTYTLTPEMAVIADDAQVHDIGGIMGGEDSGVSEGTTDVIIECAYFAPEAIARTGQTLGLTSDARQRFERGVDPAFLDDGLAIATWLVIEHCGGTASGITRAGQPPIETRSIAYDPGLCAALGGIAVEEGEQRAILERLGFKINCHSREGGNPSPELSFDANEGRWTPDRVRGDKEYDIERQWNVVIPSWRRDIDGPADLVEEVIRIKGLDHIPSVALPRAEGVAQSTLTPAQTLERRARRAAAAAGLNEAVNWSFISQKEAAAFGGGEWTLANPISEEMKVMRSSLLPGLLSAGKRNLDRGATSVRLFEVGRRYFKGKGGVSDERLTLGLVLAGDKAPRDWQAGKASGFNAYDAKAMVEAVLEAAGIDPAKLMVMGEAGEHYHPGQSATLRLGPQKIVAALGALHPSTAKAFGLKGGAMAAEIFLDAIPAKKAASPVRAAYAPPALQSVTRDFAFLIDDNVAAGDLLRTVQGADKANIAAARLFDRFAGEGVGVGKVSLAVEITLQPAEKSYTEEELTAISDKVVKAAAKLGAELRG